VPNSCVYWKNASVSAASGLSNSVADTQLVRTVVDLLHKKWSLELEHYDMVMRYTQRSVGIYYGEGESNKIALSWHSTTPTSSPTSSRGSSQECRRVVQIATGITSGNRACRTCRRGSSRGCTCRCRCRRRGTPALSTTCFRRRTNAERRANSVQ